MSKKQEIFNQTRSYGSATLLTQLITLAVAVVTRRLLGPVQTGIWALLQVILQYASYSSLGTPEAVTREIPFYQGKDDHARADEIRDLVFSFAFLTSVIFAAFTLAAAFILKDRIQPEFFFGLIFTAALIVLQRINNLLIALLRAYKHFSVAGRQMIYSAIANAFFVAVLSYRFEIYGFMWAMCLSFLFNIAYILLHHPYRLRWTLDIRKTAPLIGYGFPLMLLGLANTLFLTADKIMIAKMLDMEALGLYSVAVLAYQYLEKLPMSAGTVLIPYIHAKYGEREHPEDLKNYVLYPAVGLSLLLPLLIGAAWFFSPVAINLVLPRFMPGLPALKCLIFGSFFLAVGQPFSHLIIATRKHFAIFPILIGTTVAAALMNYGALRSGMGITGVAAATVAALFFKFSWFYFYSAKKILPGTLVAKHYSSLLFTIAAAAGLLQISEAAVSQVLPDESSWLWSLIAASAGALLFSFLFILFWCVINRNSALLKDLLETVKKRIKNIKAIK